MPDLTSDKRLDGIEKPAEVVDTHPLINYGNTNRQCE